MQCDYIAYLEDLRSMGNGLLIQLRVKIQYPNPNFSRFRVKLYPTTSSSNYYSIMLRTLLGSISGNRRHGPDLSPFIRGGIIQAYRYGGGPT